MCLAEELPEGVDALPKGVPARPQRRRIHPVTWVVSAALVPVLIYDVWATVQDVQHRHAAQAYVTASLSAARPHGLAD